MAQRVYSVSTVSNISLKQVDGTKDNNLKVVEEEEEEEVGRENALPSFSLPSALSDHKSSDT